MYRGLAAVKIAVVFAGRGRLASAQVPADQLIVSPPGAEKFVVFSAVGPARLLIAMANR
jgi:hypothetical protein